MPGCESAATAFASDSMRERRDGLRLRLEAREGDGVRGEALGEDLEGDVALEPRIAGPVDDPHSPGRDRREDDVRTELPTCGERQPVTSGGATVRRRAREYVPPVRFA